MNSAYQKSADNLKTCLMGKVSSEQKVKSPSIDLQFEVKQIDSKTQSKLILAAIDKKTGTFLYLAENDPADGRWKAMESEFYGRIYLFVEKIIEEIEFEADFDEMSIKQQSQVLEKVANKVFSNFND
jgi:hypothetical protein